VRYFLQHKITRRVSSGEGGGPLEFDSMFLGFELIEPAHQMVGVQIFSPPGGSAECSQPHRMLNANEAKTTFLYQVIASAYQKVITTNVLHNHQRVHNVSLNHQHQQGDERI
jgi:hypothetical protein